MTTSSRSGAGGRWLLVILAVSLGLKLTVWWLVTGSDPSRFFTPDSHSYHHSARALVELGAFAASPEQPETPQTIRTPGYSVFLAAVYAVFQARPETAILAQILLSLATLALVWRIAADRWDRRVALLSVLLLACDPNSLSHSLLLLTETLFTLLICCLLWVAVRCDRTGTEHRWPLMLGLVLALATLVRPVSYYLALPLGVWVGLAAGWRVRSWRRATIGIACFALPYLLLIGGWHWRNWHQTGTAVFSRIEGVNMLFYRGAAIVAQRDGISIEEARGRLGKGRYDELYPETRGWTDEELAGRWQREGLELIMAHPLIVARQQLHGLAAIFAGTGEHTLMRLLTIPIPPTGPLGDLLRLDPKSYLERWPLGRPFSFSTFIVFLTYLGVLYAGTAKWLMSSRRSSATSAWDLCAWGIFLYLALISAGPEAYHRFRVPITPILCLYAAAALSPLIRKVSLSLPALRLMHHPDQHA